eukprot:gnl/MRDRNA2_/MRDRNA2_26417_c0_seq1.p1 gnl/MRDRNA2_/MRDRNA2_26417_c0~~gnl/MRDRNA2_/MRDRNA2_26417_c0_seq1.p1  ORF type:complete len:142 (+),score=31.54 gnl/MRDRNA2_/MRDRNA2_26417_c0_seq1:77-502(+)
MRQAMDSSLKACTRVIEQEIKDFQPEVVVGSSWGGAIALQCMERGTWCGPCVLLAPALQISGWGGLFWPSGPKAISVENAKQTIVVHGTADFIVPMASSQSMCQEHGIKLVEIQGGDHQLNDQLLNTNRLENLVMEVAGRS